MEKNRLIRIAGIALTLVIAAMLIYFAFLEIMPELIPLLESGNAEQIEAYLRSSDRHLGLVFTALLQAVQVFSIVLPGLPIQVAAGIVYGTWRGFFTCHLAFVAANVIIFTLARRFGEKLDKFLPIEKKESKLDFLLKSVAPSYMTILASLMPIVPNGIIPYVAAKTKIKTSHFVVAVYFGSFLPILVFCAIGNKLLKGGYVTSGILLAGLCILLFLLTKYRDTVQRLVGKLSERLRSKREHP
jgi:uncharacterized membrane protein YdjX (TVP38/TMEM64 family)